MVITNKSGVSHSRSPLGDFFILIFLPLMSYFTKLIREYSDEYINNEWAVEEDGFGYGIINIVKNTCARVNSREYYFIKIIFKGITNI